MGKAGSLAAGKYVAVPSKRRTPAPPFVLARAGRALWTGLVSLSLIGCSPLATHQPSGTARATIASTPHPASTPAPSVEIAFDGDAAGTALADSLLVLNNQDRWVYRIESRVKVADGTVAVEEQRLVEVDRTGPRGEVRLRRHMNDTTLQIRVVADDRTAYATSSDFTGSLRGRWLHIKDDAGEVGMAVAGVDLSMLFSAPGGLSTFKASGGTPTSLQGSVDAAAGINLLGLSKLLEDATFRETVKGRVPAIVELDPNTGNIRAMTINGAGHTITGNSAELTRTQRNALLDHASATLTMEPDPGMITVTFPPASKVFEGPA